MAQLRLQISVWPETSDPLHHSQIMCPQDGIVLLRSSYDQLNTTLQLISLPLDALWPNSTNYGLSFQEHATLINCKEFVRLWAHLLNKIGLKVWRLILCLGYKLAAKIQHRFPKNVPPKPLSQVITSASDDALDLISQMLRYNPLKRPNASQALAHRYFIVALPILPSLDNIDQQQE